MRPATVFVDRQITLTWLDVAAWNSLWRRCLWPTCFLFSLSEWSTPLTGFLRFWMRQVWSQVNQCDVREREGGREGGRERRHRERNAIICSGICILTSAVHVLVSVYWRQRQEYDMFWYLYADVRGRIRDVFWYLYTDVRGRIMITCSRICMLRWRVDNDDVCICMLTSNAGYNAMLPARWLQMQPYMLWYLYAVFRGRYRWHQSAADYRQRINFQENRICLQHWRRCQQIRHQVTCFAQ